MFGIFTKFLVISTLTVLFQSDLWGFVAAPKQSKLEAKSGSIDLGNWSPETPLELVGEWMFFPKTLLTPEAFQQAWSTHPEKLKFTRTGLSFVESDPEAYADNKSYASYAVILKNIPRSSLAITAANVYTNGSFRLFPLKDPAQAIQIEIGKVGLTAAESKPAIQLQDLLPFHPLSSEDYVLIVQISNFHHDWGGLWIPPTIGAYQVLADTNKSEDRLSYWIIGLIFFLTIYHLALYSRHPEDKSSLFLSIFGGCIAIRVYAIANYDLDIFPVASWNYEFQLKIIYLTMLLGSAIFLIFLRSCFPERLSSRTLRFCLYLVGPPSLFVLVTPASVYTQFLEPLRILGLLLSAFGLRAYVKAIRARDEGALISFIGASVVMIGYVFDILNSFGFSIFPANSAGVGLGFFVICQSQIVAQRFARAFRQSEYLSRELQNEVQRQTIDIKSILTNIKQGIFTVNRRDMTIDDQHSEYLKDITGESAISGRTIRTLLLDRSNLTEDTKALTEASLEAALDEDEMAFDVNAGNLVRELEYRSPQGDQKIIELDWNPVVDIHDKVEKILVSVWDVTQLRKLEAEAKKKEKDLKSVLDLIRIPEDRFMRFADKTRAFIKENREIISSRSEGSPELVKRLFVNMHTIKGAARTYNLQAISAASHEVEQTYAAIQKGLKEWNQTLLLDDLSKVEEAVDFYCSIAATQLNWEFADKAVRMSRREIERTLELLIKLEHQAEARELASISEVERFLMEHCYTDLAGVIEESCRGLDSIARDLGKPSPRIDIQNAELVLKDRGVDLLHNILTHLFRNALDHGIEHPEQRLALGKPEVGCIRIATELREGFVEFTFSDDGAGLNLVKLEKLGWGKGLLTQDSVSDQAVAELIFSSGLSTKDTVSEISGRGVGLDAVRSYLEDVGGEVQILLQPGPDREHMAFEFLIKIPSDFCFLPGAPSAGNSHSHKTAS